MKAVKQQLDTPCIDAEKSIRLEVLAEEFRGSSAGILYLLPFLKKYEIVSSSMVIKVDFDLTMSVLTHNIYWLF